MENRLCFPIPPDRLVLLLESLQYLGWRILGSSTVKDGVRRILNGKLDLLSRRVSSQERNQRQRRIQPSRHTGGANDVAVHCDSGIHKDGTVMPHQVPSAPMGRHLSSDKPTRCATQ